MTVPCTITRAGGSKEKITLTAAIDTLDEVDYYRHGGILHYVLRQRLAAEPPAGTAD
jgi:aconitate hydratase